MSPRKSTDFDVVTEQPDQGFIEPVDEEFDEIDVQNEMNWSEFNLPVSDD